jgi:hypothetical protein
MEQLNQQLGEVRRQLADVTQRVQQASGVAADLEKQLLQAKDDNRKKELSMQLDDMKMQQDAGIATQQQLQARESDLGRELSTEQARWVELNTRIDELEQSLAPVRKQP